MDDLYSKRPPDGFSRKPDDSRSETYILPGVVRYSSKVDDLYRKRRPDGFAGEPKLKIPEICRTGAPHRPPSSYPPRPPRPPDSEKFESRGGLPPENRVRWVGGAHTRENGEFAGETSNLESPKIRKIGKSVPPFAPPVRTPRGPPGGKTGENCLIGYVVHRKTTSNLSWGYTRAKGPNVRTMSQSPKWSKLHDFQLVAFCEQTGGRFCRFGGAPLRPPGSSPPSANRAKRIGRELDTTVDLRIFGSAGLEGE